LNRRVLFLLLLTILTPPVARAADGYRFLEGTAASVNKEVLFVSDVRRERCLLRCAAMPGSEKEDLSLEEARSRLIADTLALQEHEKLALGQVDNATLADRVREAQARTAGCDLACREGISPGEIGKWVERKLLVRDFLRRRVGAFVEVKDDDVRREYQRRSAGEPPRPG